MPEGHSGSIRDDTAQRRGRTPLTAPFAMPVQHFYRTSALPCPYVASRVERKLVTELEGRDAVAFYNDLSRAGFRRSHHLAYRPACAGCASCVPVRVVAGDFRPSRSTRRLTNINADLTATEQPARASAEQYRLFLRYQRSRHFESDMAAMTFGDYRAMIEDSPIDTRLIEFRDATRRLVGACLVDRLDDGYSAVYSFYETAQAKRSLGTYMVLWLVEAARRQALPFVYLGYWIAESPKMAYKIRFRPLEALGAKGWEPLAIG